MRRRGRARASSAVDWRAEFLEWLTPFLAAFGREAQRHWAPVYLEGLLGPGDRKSVEPMAARVCPGETQQLHHFVSTSPWATEPLERVLAEVADQLVGGPDAVLIIDDTALPKQGRHSVGVARQYCGALGKRANCQVLVSLTLAHAEVPVPLALRLYLPELWASDAERRAAAKVPEAIVFQTKGALALAELDRVTAAGVRFGSSFGLVLADAGYGTAAEFRAGLTARGLRWAVGIPGELKVYPVDVTLTPPTQGPTGRPRKHPVPSLASMAAAAMIAALGPRAFRRLSWRAGTQGPLVAEFAAVRVRVADGPLMAKAQHLPGAAAWLVCERRTTGDQKYYLTNHPARTSLRTLARAIKARWSCEQGHQQLKEELGLDHFEGRSWLGLHHHALLTMIAFAFLQHRRLAAAHAATTTARRRRVGEKTTAPHARSATRAVAPRDAPRAPGGAPRDHHPAVPTLSLPTAAAAA
jgi:SRSO17 transposase